MSDPYPDAVNLMFVAVMGALLTVGLRTGSFAPLAPQVTRTETPKAYWIGLCICALIVIRSLATLIWLALRG